MTACRIRRAEAHFLNLDTCYWIANKTFWRGQPDKFHALFFGVLNFALTAGHIRAVTAIQAFHRGRTLTNRTAHTVHRSITTADHDNFFAFGIQCASVKIRHSIAKAFAVGRGEIIQRLDDPRSLMPCNVQVARFIDACRDHDEVVLFAQRLKGDVAANIGVQLELDPAFFQKLIAAHHHGLFQFEPWNPVGQKPACAVITIIDCHLKPRAAQTICGSQTAWPCANDAHGFCPLGCGGDGHHPTFIPCGIGDVLLDRADGDRAMPRLFDHTIAFAQAILRADTPTDFRECVCGLADLIGLA